MNNQKIILELPAITDQAAASLQKFIQALLYAVDEHYFRQIHCHYKKELDNLLMDAQPTQECLDDPLF
jgi:hypothetical protein